MTIEEKFRDAIERVMKPQDDADRLLMHTAVIAFLLGALLF